MSLQEFIEATIRERPQDFVVRCDVTAILSAIDSYGISDIDGLLVVLNDAEQKADLRRAIGGVVTPAGRLNRDLFMNNDKNGDRMNKSYS